MFLISSINYLPACGSILLQDDMILLVYPFYDVYCTNP